MEQPLQDDALAPFLGGADRALFERMFGLDHQRLRQAGERMIQSDEDLGQAIFEAGSGVDSLNHVLGGLAAEIDVLGAPGQKASRKPLWRSADDYANAQRERRADTLKLDEVRAAERKAAAAKKERERVASELADVRKRKARVERIRRVGPIAADIDRLLDELGAMGAVPELPASFEGEWAELAKSVAAKEHAIGAAASRLEEAQANLGASPEVLAYAAHESAIGAVREGLGRYRKDVADELKLSRDVAVAEEGIGIRLRALGHDPERVLRDGDPRTLMPTAAEMARACGVVQAEVAAGARREELGRVLSGAERELEAAAAESADCSAAVDPGPAAALVEEALGLGDVEAGALDARLAADGAARMAAEAVARLRGWAQGADALASCPFPDAAAVAALDARIAGAAAERDAAGENVAKDQQALVDVRARLAQLQAGGEVPTPEAIAAMRERREAGWRAIRDAYVGGLGPGVPVDPSDARSRAAAFEGAVRRADELVDRREADAQRVAAAAELRAAEVALQGRLELDRMALERAESGADRAAGEWAALWAPTGVAPGAPPAMASWLRAKDEALRLLAAAREASDRRERADAMADQARALRSRAAALLGLPEAGRGDQPRAQAEDLRVALAGRRALWSRAQAAAANVARCSAKRDEAQRSLAGLSQTDAARLGEWSALAGRLGWREGASVAEAEAVLQNWEGMAAPLSDRETARRRLAGIREDNRSFRTQVAEVELVLVRIAGAAPAGTAGTPESVVRRLDEGLAAEKVALARSRAARQEVETAARRLDEDRAAFARAKAAANAFRRIHALAPDADCIAVGKQAALARHLRETVAQRRVDLMVAGEGLGELAVREEAASMPPEAVVAEITALGEQEDVLVEAGQVAAQEWSAADAALAEVASRAGGIDAHAREQAAALAFAGHAERWLVLAAAQGIMLRSVERYRAQNQHPMVARAGELMAELTRGHANPIGRLSAEYRDKKRLSLIGIRSDGTPCEIANMTEGTRDQLFLGLRIAAIERYAQARETLPFVADDLFITSDDERTECGLQALAALARTTQVILFTHHRSVLRSAQGLAGTHGVTTHKLPSRSAPGIGSAVAAGV